MLRSRRGSLNSIKAQLRLKVLLLHRCAVVLVAARVSNMLVAVCYKRAIDTLTRLLQIYICVLVLLYHQAPDRAW